jgi:hypothetical protein
MISRPVVFILLFSTIALGACSGGGTHSGVYYGNRIGPGPGPWYNRGVYVRDRVHVVSADEVRAVEEVARELEHMSDPLIDTPDMGGGDLDMGGFDDDF